MECILETQKLLTERLTDTATLDYNVRDMWVPLCYEAQVSPWALRVSENLTGRQ